MSGYDMKLCSVTKKSFDCSIDVWRSVEVHEDVIEPVSKQSVRFHDRCDA